MWQTLTFECQMLKELMMIQILAGVQTPVICDGIAQRKNVILVLFLVTV